MVDNRLRIVTFHPGELKNFVATPPSRAILPAMNLQQTALVAGAGFLAGMINAVAGGGSFLTLPALVFCGLPSTAANQTSTVALWPGALASFGVYRREISAHPRLAWLMGGVSVLGGVAGAWILLHTTPLTFDRLLPWLTLFATLLFAFGKRLSQRLQLSLGHADDRRSLTKTGVIFFFIAIYGGYYGAGAGIVLLAVLALLGLENIHAMNGYKTLANVSFNISAVAMFVWGGAIYWPGALWMMGGGAAGGYGGAWLARRLPPSWIRGFVIGAGVVTTGYFFYRLGLPGRG